jgi:hypothetical protein
VRGYFRLLRAPLGLPGAGDRSRLVKVAGARTRGLRHEVRCPHRAQSITWALKDHRGNELFNILQYQAVRPDAYAQVKAYTAALPGTV